MPWSKSAVESPERTRERLMAKVRVAPSGCWEWTAYIDKGTGYGRLNTPSGVKWAHRVSYEIHAGPIPAGMPLDHLCRNHTCVNPAHLEVVTPAENVWRGQAPTILIAKTGRCIWGHSFADAYIRKNGNRMCRPCKRRRDKEWRLRSRAGAA